MIRYRGLYASYDDSIILVNLTNPPLPEITYQTQKIPLMTGVLGISKTHNARVIKATFQLNGKSAARNAQLAAALALWAESEATHKLILDEATDRFYRAILTETTEIDYSEAWPEVTLTFTCPNPYAFSIAEYSENVGDAIAYDGDVSVWPVIEFTPATDLSSAQWTDGTRTLKIEGTDYTLQAGHKFVIDCANKVITDNGDSIMQHMTLLSDWLHLQRGINTITGAGGVVKWRNIYL